MGHGRTVALRSILDTDFIFGADDNHTNELDTLYQQTITKNGARPNVEAVFTVVVRPMISEEGLTVQVGHPNGNSRQFYARTAE